MSLPTLAIIGGGVAAHSLLFSLSRSTSRFSKIYHFSSETFAPSCSLNSTAVVALRGVSSGHSRLGDLLVEGFETFKNHVATDRPGGVEKSLQFTAGDIGNDKIQKRFPQGNQASACEFLSFNSELFIAQEEAFIISPEIYLKWLLAEAKKSLVIEVIPELVTEVMEKDSLVEIKTQSQERIIANELIIAGGALNPQWQSFFPQSEHRSRPIQGAYLQFLNVNWATPSFSLTIHGENVIYHKNQQRLLIGSTTRDTNHSLINPQELEMIYNRVKAKIKLEWPAFGESSIRIGHREKASKREPYLLEHGQIQMIGGLYKNGYSLSLAMAKKVNLKD